MHASMLTTSRLLGSDRNSRFRLNATPANKDINNASNARPARLAKILKQYDGTIEEQQEKLAEYQAQKQQNYLYESDVPKEAAPRYRKRTAGDRYQSKDPEHIEKMQILFTKSDKTGNQVPIIGGFGRGKPQWWSIWVKAGREKQVVESLERRLSLLPPLEILSNKVSEDGSLAAVIDVVDDERTIESWIPLKRVRAWNPKSNKMGNRQLKYDEGGWVFIKTTLDQHFVEYVTRNVNVLGFRDKERFNGVDFPVPASQAVMDEIKAWEQDLADLDEETVRAMLGLPDKKEPDWEDLQAQNEAAFYEQERMFSGGYAGGRGDRGGRFGGRGGRGGRMSMDGMAGLYSADSSSSWYDGESTLSSSPYGESNERGYYNRDDTRARGRGRGERGGRGQRGEGRGRGRGDSASSSPYKESAGDAGWFTPSSSNNDNDDDLGLASWFDDTAAVYEAAASGYDPDFNNNDDAVGDSDDTLIGGGFAASLDNDVWSAAFGGDSNDDDAPHRASTTRRDSVPPPPPPRQQQRQPDPAANDLWGSSDASTGDGFNTGGWLDDFSDLNLNDSSFGSGGGSGGGGGYNPYNKSAPQQPREQGTFGREFKEREPFSRDSPRDGGGERGSYDRDSRGRGRGGGRGDNRGGRGGERRSYDRDNRFGGDRNRRDDDRGGRSSFGRDSRSRDDHWGGGQRQPREDRQQWGAFNDANSNSNELSWWDDAADSTSPGGKTNDFSGDKWAGVFEGGNDGVSSGGGERRSTSGSSSRRGESSRDNTSRARYDDDAGAKSYSSESTTAGAGVTRGGGGGDSANLPAIGSTVSIVEGPFKDFDGKVLGGDSSTGKVSVQVDVFGKPAVVKMDIGDVKQP